MSKKILLSILILALIVAGIFGYLRFKNKPLSPAKTIEIINDSVNSDSQLPPNSDLIENKPENPMDNNSNTASDSGLNDPMTVDPSASSSDSSTDTKAPPVSATPSVSGSMLAHITPEHCNDSCQAFAIDLTLFEYCEQACGISPVKKVSSCDDKKDLQKDYCNKDLAIGKQDASICDKIKDANIKEACKNRIQQDIIENLTQ